MNPKENVVKILRLIDGKEAGVREIVTEMSHSLNFALSNSIIANFCLSSIDQIFEAAVHSKTEENAEFQRASYFILRSQMNSFLTLLLTSESYLSLLNNFTKHLESEDKYSITTWCKLMQTYIDTTGSSFLNVFPEKKKFFKRLIPYLSNMSIYQLVFSICNEGHMHSINFLEKSHASTVFYKNIRSENQVEVLKLMSVFISSCDSNSSLVSSLAKRERVDTIFSLAVDSNVRVSDAAMQLLFELSSHCDEDDNDEGSLFQVIFMHVSERISEIADFICTEAVPGVFSRGRDKAIDLLIGILSIQETVPPDVFRVISYLWNEMFKHPLLSIMHCSMVRLFKAAMESDGCCEDFLTSEKIREKIIQCSMIEERVFYIGHLFEVAKMIIESEDDEKKTGEWLQFINGPYEQMRSLIQNPYGGVCPPRHPVKFNEINVEGSDAGFNTVGIPESTKPIQ